VFDSPRGVYWPCKIFSAMNQKSIVLDFHLRVILAQEVHEELVARPEVKSLLRAIHLRQIIALRRLSNSLRFVLGRLRWASYLLSEAQRPPCLKQSSSLLRVLQVQQQRAWHDVIILDESWFYGRINDESICRPSNEKVGGGKLSTLNPHD
jgi:hypothetical protein